MLKNNKIRIFTLVVAAALIFAGCGSNNQSAEKIGNYKSPGKSENIQGVASENDNYQLIWDDSQKSISIYDKSDGSVVTTTKPETETKVNEYGFVIKQDSRMISDLVVEYIDKQTGNSSTLYSAIDSVDSGNVTCKRIENGIEVTYYFANAEIAVPVKYTLSQGGFSVSIDSKKITENENKVLSVSVTPFACSYKNDAVDSYLFIPSGSGALIYPKNISSGGAIYSEDVYGTDPLDVVWSKDSNEQTVKLPVYGVKNGNSGLCAIISSGADSATINSIYGSSSIGSSSVYSTFNIRGTSTIRKKLFGNREVKSVQRTEGVVQSVCQVDFYILKGNDANYSGMAKVFRQNALKETNTQTANSAISLVIYGGALVEKSFLGIPYKSVYAATTVDQAYQMVKELNEETGANLSVLLKGFGKSGIDIGKIGGGYTLSNNLGSKSDLNQLGAYCKENNIGIYFDFDVVRQTAMGWFSSKDTALSVDKQAEYQYIYDKALLNRITDSRYSLISRNSLLKCTDKLISKTKKWDIDGIALDTLSNIAYSDYGDSNCIAKERMSSDVSSVFTKLREAGKKVASVSANYYAADNSDAIFETPSTSSKNNAFAVDVPFYQMVFKGKVDIGCEAVNLTFEQKDAILKSVESGAGITYALYNNYDTSLTNSWYSVFATGKYSAIKQDILNEFKDLKGYYDAIANTYVKEHFLISNDVRKTVFENGTVAYVNYSDNDYTGNFGTVSAHDYLIVLSAG